MLWCGGDFLFCFGFFVLFVLFCFFRRKKILTNDCLTQQFQSIKQHPLPTFPVFSFAFLTSPTCHTMFSFPYQFINFFRKAFLGCVKIPCKTSKLSLISVNSALDNQQGQSHLIQLGVSHFWVEIIQEMLWAPECAEERCVTLGASQGCGAATGGDRGLGGSVPRSARVLWELWGSEFRGPELLCRGACACQVSHSTALLMPSFAPL